MDFKHWRGRTKTILAYLNRCGAHIEYCIQAGNVLIHKWLQKPFFIRLCRNCKGGEWPFKIHVLHNISVCNFSFFLQYNTKEDLLPHLLECDIIVYDITRSPEQVDEATWAVSGTHNFASRVC